MLFYMDVKLCVSRGNNRYCGCLWTGCCEECLDL